VLTGFSIRNFKNLEAVPANEGELIPFGRVNVLIGPNGCGKSSLLQSIDFLRAFFMSSVELYLKDRGWDYSDLPNLRQTSKIIRWKLIAELGPDDSGLCAGRYHYVLDEFLDHSEQVYCFDRPAPLAGATIVRLSDKKEVTVARHAFEQSLGEAWTSGLIGATAGMRYP